MATNLISNTGRDDNRRRTVHFDSNSLNFQGERSGRLSGIAWRKQQSEIRQQKKKEEARAAAEEEEKKNMQQMANVYRIFKTDGFEDRVLTLAENNTDFAGSLDEFLMAAGTPGDQTMRQKLQWFRDKHRNRELNDAFISRTYVRSTLYYLCRTNVFRMEFCFVSVPHASSSESETTHNGLLSAEQRRALEQTTHGSGQIVGKNLRATFAESTSTNDDSPTAAEANKVATVRSAAAAQGVFFSGARSRSKRS